MKKYKFVKTMRAHNKDGWAKDLNAFKLEEAEGYKQIYVETLEDGKEFEFTVFYEKIPTYSIYKWQATEKTTGMNCGIGKTCSECEQFVAMRAGIIAKRLNSIEKENKAYAVIEAVKNWYELHEGTVEK